MPQVVRNYLFNFHFSSTTFLECLTHWITTLLWSCINLEFQKPFFKSVFWFFLGQTAKVIGYGHLGDGNLHLNISAPQYNDAVISYLLHQRSVYISPSTCVIIYFGYVTPQIFAQIEPYVYEWTSNHRGSISAEHGLGLMKANKVYYSKSPETVSSLFYPTPLFSSHLNSLFGIVDCCFSILCTCLCLRQLCYSEQNA